MTISRTPRTPSYRHHKASGRAFVEFDGQRFYLGRFNSPESVQKYHSMVAEWLANDRQLPVAPEEITWRVPQIVTVSGPNAPKAKGLTSGTSIFRIRGPSIRSSITDCRRFVLC